MSLIRKPKKAGLRLRTLPLLASLLCVPVAGSCWGYDRGEAEVKMKVTATAYNSLPGQTEGNPSIGAWGHRLKPGIKAIAVSRDLLAMGLEPGSEVTIDGLPGRYKVLDKMGGRWRKKIDIYMGVDRDAALEWGKRPVVIRFSNENS
ncbi:MAG: 3D domain-containing protein [Oceanospirillaceae bacterium]|nr:3D domain-containing protein [Oceanospirillaceae bacterium]